MANHLDTDTSTLEGSIGDWVSNFSATPTRSTAQAHGGSASLRVDITVTTWGVVIATWPGVAATVGAKTISFWGRNGSGTIPGAKLIAKWRDDAGSELGQSELTLTGLSSSWQQATSNVTSPSGTTKVKVEIGHSAEVGTSGDFIYLDDIYVGDLVVTGPAPGMHVTMHSP